MLYNGIYEDVLSHRADCRQMSERKKAANLLRSAPLISDPPYIALIGQCILLDTIE
jgi:hypothetical protein